MYEVERGGYIFKPKGNESIVINSDDNSVVGTIDVPAEEVEEMDERAFIKKLEENFII